MEPQRLQFHFTLCPDAIETRTDTNGSNATNSIDKVDSSASRAISRTS